MHPFSRLDHIAARPEPFRIPAAVEAALAQRDRSFERELGIVPDKFNGPHPGFEFRNQGNGTAELRIYDEISWWGISADRFTAELEALGAVDTINVRINSPGGDVFDGMAIYRQLLDHDATVNVQVDGIAASIASIIMLAGDSVNLAQHAMVMTHQAWSFTIGNADDHEEVGAILRKFDQTLAGIYAARAGGTVAEWLDRMNAETWFTADEALEAGLATTVLSDERIDENAVEDASARFDLSRFKNLPERLKTGRIAAQLVTPDGPASKKAAPAIADWRNAARLAVAEAEMEG